MKSNFDAVLFDLLSALTNSWSLWDDLAGDTDLGRKPPRLSRNLRPKLKLVLLPTVQRSWGTNVQNAWEHHSMLLLLQSVPDITNRTRRFTRKLFLKSAQRLGESYMSQDLHWTSVAQQQLVCLCTGTIESA